MPRKIFPNAAAALDGLLFDGMTVMAGGFGLCGIPEDLILALRDSGVEDLTVIGNNVGCDQHGLWHVLANHQIRKVILSYAGDNKLLEQSFLTGEIEIEFNPQGTLAERIRAGGAGILAFYTRTGYGTVIAEGKETKQFGGKGCVLETALTADVSLVKAWKGDSEGNLIYRKTARNFNPMMATAGAVTVAEVELLVDVGDLHPDHIHTPGIFVDRIFRGVRHEKHIERRATRERAPSSDASGAGG
ncbi:MAG: CoA transferase subunit A [Steroidobacteraceae bacterium]